MTPILYAKPDIKDDLINSGERTWCDVTVIRDVRYHYLATVSDFMTVVFRDTFFDRDAAVSAAQEVLDQLRSDHFSIEMVAKPVLDDRLAFTFANESAAMAFRLRYSDYLVDRPRHPDCDALMALEVV